MLLDVWEAHANQDIYILIRLIMPKRSNNPEEQNKSSDIEQQPPWKA